MVSTQLCYSLEKLYVKQSLLRTQFSRRNLNATLSEIFQSFFVDIQAYQTEVKSISKCKSQNNMYYEGKKCKTLGSKILPACQEHHYYIHHKETKLRQCTEGQTRKRTPALVSLYMSVLVSCLLSVSMSVLHIAQQNMIQEQ